MLCDFKVGVAHSKTTEVKKELKLKSLIDDCGEYENLLWLKTFKVDSTQ
jgi:hypothetical protein